MIQYHKNQHGCIYLCINRANVFTESKSAAGIGKLVFHNNSVLVQWITAHFKNDTDKNFDGRQLLWMVIKSHRDWLQKNLQKS